MLLVRMVKKVYEQKARRDDRGDTGYEGALDEQALARIGH